MSPHPVPDPQVDARWMAVALGLARRGLGLTWPNPSVGCVVVRDGMPIVQTRTADGGRPHAEALAVEAAGGALSGATVYVSLEPCAHHGRTPPCADALIAARPARVVVAIRDPDPRVDGRGLARLREAGIAVTEGVLADDAAEVARGFFTRIGQGRPLVTVKMGQTQDGRIATQSGDSKWITGELARARAHLLRATHDAVAVGAETARADDPGLGCRLPGFGTRRPLRIVIDGRIGLSPQARMLRPEEPGGPVWIVTTHARLGTPLADALRRAGAELIAADAAPSAEGRIDLASALQALGARGLTRLLVEGGGRLVAGLLRAGLVDRLALCRANLLLGGDACASIGPLGLARVAEAVRLELIDRVDCGDDLLETFRVAG